MKSIGYLRMSCVALFSVAIAACSAGSGGGTAKPGPQPEKPTAETRLAPSSVPQVNDGSPASSDRDLMLSAIKRADTENKKIILDVSAAWCGPCQEFASDFDGHPEYLKELTEQNYIMVRAEYEKMVSGAGLDFLSVSDFMPMFIQFFPSFLVYEKGQWTLLGSYGSYSELKSRLAEKIVPLTYAELSQALASGGDVSKDVSSRLNASLFGNYQSRYSYEQAVALIKLTSASKSAEVKSYAGFMKMFVPIYVGIGAVSVGTLAKDFPEYAAGLTDASSEGFSIRIFSYQLQMLRREEGLKATVEQCAGKWQAYRSQIQPGKLSSGDFQTKLSSLDLTAKVICAHLDWTLNGVTAKLKADVAAIDKTKIKDWALLGAVGEVDAALKVYDDHYQDYVKFYTEGRTKLDEALTKAIASKDQAKIDEANHDIAVHDFRSKFHAEVNADVQGNLRCGAGQTSVSVLN